MTDEKKRTPSKVALENRAFAKWNTVRRKAERAREAAERRYREAMKRVEAIDAEVGRASSAYHTLTGTWPGESVNTTTSTEINPQQ